MMIKEFYEETKHEFPELTYKQVEDICLSPFKYVRYIFDEGTLDDIQLKHLGKFKVIMPRVKSIKKRLQVKEYADAIGEEKLNRLQKKIEEYELRHSESGKLCSESSDNIE